MSCLLSEVEINPKWSKNILFKLYVSTFGK